MLKSPLLVVTASDANRKLIRDALFFDFDLDDAKSGAEALAILKKKRPAAVVMDHSIEDFLTYAFIDKVRNSPVSRNLPFILISRESTNSFVEQAVRAGVSHYVGIPFEPAALIQKIKSALNPAGPKDWKLYFRMPGQIESQAVSFGRISYVSEHGVHFETHLKLALQQRIQFSAPFLKDMGIDDTEIEIESVNSDVYYNYPQAMDAKWCDEKLATRMRGWVALHKNLNAPKKKKILYLQNDLALGESFSRKLNASHYSLRVVTNFSEALESLPFMKPACFVVEAEVWERAGADGAKILEQLSRLGSRWMLVGDNLGSESKGSVKPFICPNTVEAMAAGVEQIAPPFVPEPDRIYFSKTLDYSRCNFHFSVKTLILGEMGVRLAFPFEVFLPCNLQLGLKIFTEQNLRNPYVRAWPPLEKLDTKDSNEGKYAWAAETHFLGINDSQGQAIRLWLRNEEMKETRAELYKTPKREGQDASDSQKDPKKTK